MNDRDIIIAAIRREQFTKRVREIANTLDFNKARRKSAVWEIMSEKLGFQVGRYLRRVIVKELESRGIISVVSHKIGYFKSIKAIGNRYSPYRDEWVKNDG